MRIRLTDPDPELLRELYVLLAEPVSCVARLDDGEIEAGLVGSYADGGLSELALLVGEWQRQHPGVAVEVRA
jgi:hypothetical protein